MVYQCSSSLSKNYEHWHILNILEGPSPHFWMESNIFLWTIPWNISMNAHSITIESRQDHPLFTLLYFNIAMVNHFEWVNHRSKWAKNAAKCQRLEPRNLWRCPWNARKLLGSPRMSQDGFLVPQKLGISWDFRVGTSWGDIMGISWGYHNGDQMGCSLASIF